MPSLICTVFSICAELCICTVCCAPNNRRNCAEFSSSLAEISCPVPNLAEIERIRTKYVPNQSESGRLGGRPWCRDWMVDRPRADFSAGGPPSGAKIAPKRALGAEQLEMLSVGRLAKCHVRLF